jgi:putative mycofactocin binding protein MftB
MEKRYLLAKGTQVRKEDFGLLFYQMNGPRLHFVASGNLLGEAFFQGKITLQAWMDSLTGIQGEKGREAKALSRALKHLTDKGVIVEY